MKKSIFEKVVTSNPKITDFVFTRSPPGLPRKKGQKKALAAFKVAAEEVPAYKHFLKKHKVDPALVESLADFKTLVPSMDKDNYLDKYPFDKKCLGGTVKGKFMLDGSSGYHGKPYYWPSFCGQRDLTPSYLEYLAYKYHWFEKDKLTLVIINLGLGLWVAGNMCTCAYREIANRGRFPITVVSPGVDVEGTIELVKEMGRYYDNILFVSYPPLAKVVLEEGIKAGIKWKKHNVSLFVGGEGHSENWRDYIARLLGFRVEGAGLERIVSVFGAADIGGIGGYETPLSIKIRRLARTNKDLSKDLFGRSDRLPQLFQYSAASNFIEIINGELAFTTLSGIPIVRYNIHDTGGIIRFEDAIEILNKHGYNIKKIMQDENYPEKALLSLDFNFVFGRADGTVTIYGANVFVENIKEALASKDIGQFFSGAFKLETKYSKSENQYLSLTLELAKGKKATRELARKSVDVVVKLLCKQNSEYKKLYLTQGRRVVPRIKIVSLLEGKGQKNKYT